MPVATPHQLRHEGASADAMLTLSDAETMNRGGLRDPRSLKRYRRPAKYVRRLELLSISQRALAAATPEFFVSKAEAILGDTPRSRTNKKGLTLKSAAKLMRVKKQTAGKPERPREKKRERKRDRERERER